MSDHRLIGIDLAWSERNGTGCVELAWEGDELGLCRVGLCKSMDEIVDWIKPEYGDWVIAVDAPLVVKNPAGRRAADARVSDLYRSYEAGAYPTNLKLLGEDHRGGQLLRRLEERGGDVVERAGHLNGPRLAFETYPHVVMVELFGLDRTIKYKKGKVADKRRGQQELADAIRAHLCGAAASPRLRIKDGLDDLLCEPDPILKGRDLKSREDKLDGLICAYAAAWLDAGRPLQGLGEVGAGVMVTPRVRGIGPSLWGADEV